MMAQATWADELAGATHGSHAQTEEDLWHVAVNPEEVKIMTLEKLDDLFRLSIVDAETRVWQPGMDAWVPLGVIAGIESETEVSEFPSAPAAQQYAEPVQTFRSVDTVKTTAVRAFTPPSVRPIVVDDLPMVTGGSSFGSWLLTLAIVAGVAVTLYRNDVVRSFAHSVQQDALFARLEKSLGGPGFGTPRAVAQYPSAHLSLAPALPEIPRATPTTTVIGGQAAPQVPSVAASNTAEPAKVAEKPVEPAVAEKPAEPAVVDKTAEKFAQKLTASKADAAPVKKATHLAPSAPAPKPISKKSRGDAGGGTGIKGSTNEYDPLNSKL
jgi:hypothetical protein